MRKIRNIFSTMPDPRAPNALHDLLDIIVIALATILCGGQGATDMEVFASSKEKLLRQFLRLEHGIPSYDTFSRVLNALDPAAFEQAFRCFALWQLSPRPTGSSSPVWWRSTARRCEERSRIGLAGAPDQVSDACRSLVSVASAPPRTRPQSLEVLLLAEVLVQPSHQSLQHRTSYRKPDLPDYPCHSGRPGSRFDRLYS